MTRTIECKLWANDSKVGRAIRIKRSYIKQIIAPQLFI